MLDPNCYDLLASEARLASFIAIAKGDAPARHWFRLGHAVTAVNGGAALISWSGSMFEYLMPSLVIRSPADSLIEQTNRLIVRRQIEYGSTLKTPWGVSESAYNARDFELTYQYSNFGVPGLGLKRGLANSAVIAPYATALASMIDPLAAVRNYERLEAIGARGRYGFYEALDFTAGRVPDGEDVAIVGAFMAHHQGMTITAIADTLLDGVTRDRASTPSPWSRPRSCCCRSACRATSWRRRHRYPTPSPRSGSATWPVPAYGETPIRAVQPRPLNSCRTDVIR